MFIYSAALQDWPLLMWQALSNADIVDNEGSKWIKKRRQKTKNWCTCAFAGTCNSNYWKSTERIQDASAKGVLLPVLSNQKMNAYLKEIADICGHK